MVSETGVYLNDSPRPCRHASVSRYYVISIGRDEKHWQYNNKRQERRRLAADMNINTNFHKEAIYSRLLCEISRLHDGVIMLIYIFLLVSVMESMFE